MAIEGVSLYYQQALSQNSLTQHFRFCVMSERTEAAIGVDVNMLLLHLCAANWGSNKTVTVDICKNFDPFAIQRCNVEMTYGWCKNQASVYKTSLESLGGGRRLSHVWCVVFHVNAEQLCDAFCNFRNDKSMQDVSGSISALWMIRGSLKVLLCRQVTELYCKCA